MSEGRQGDARAYIRLRGSTHCPTPAKQKRRSRSYTRDARGLPEELKGRQRNAREMPGRHQGVRPISFAMHIIIRLPCKRNGMELKGRQRNVTRTPKKRQRIHPTPWQCTLSYACHAKTAEPKQRQKDARRTAGPISDPLTMQIIYACHAKVAEPKERKSDAEGMPKTYIRHLSSVDYPTPATQKQRSSKDTKRTSQEYQRNDKPYIQPLSSKYGRPPATRNQRSPNSTRGTPEGRQRDVTGMPGRISDSAATFIVPRPSCKSSGAQDTPKGRQRVTKRTPEERHRDAKKTSGRTFDPLAVLIVYACHAKVWQCTVSE